LFSGGQGQQYNITEILQAQLRMRSSVQQGKANILTESCTISRLWQPLMGLDPHCMTEGGAGNLKSQCQDQNNTIIQRMPYFTEIYDQ